MKIEIYQDKAGEWRWRIVARNGRILADSGEGYKQRSKAKAALQKLIAGMCKAALTAGPRPTRKRGA